MSDADAPRPDSHRQLEVLVEQYAGLIRRVVARVAGPGLESSHDDIGQRVLVNLWRQLDREQTIEFPASYVYRAAVREAARALRQAMARPTVPLEQLPESARSDDGSRTAEDVLVAREQTERIVTALASLAPDRAKAVRAHLAGFDVNEIMTMYGWPYQKARNLITRGVADLRARLLEGNHG
jgi:RNA polymerase sigma factor (sigma-70 family)